MSEYPTIEFRTFPMLDTGLGKEAGYRDDAEMIAADERWMAGLTEDARQRERDMRIWIGRRLLFGDE